MDIVTLHAAIFNSKTEYAILALDQTGLLLYWNAGAENLIGIGGSELNASCAIIYCEDSLSSSLLADELALALTTGKFIATRQYCSIDKVSFWAESVTTPLFDSAQNHIGFLKILRDVTEKRIIEEQLIHDAKTDGLTGLANRASFDEYFLKLAGVAAREQKPIILHLIDLDHFKAVNDTLGHQAGDNLLRRVAQSIKNVTRESDFVARLGGDEFAVLQTGADSSLVGSILAEKLLEALAGTLNIEGQSICITASIGIAVAPQDSWVPDELVRRADAALYRVKRHGRHGYEYFTEALDKEARDHKRDMIGLQQAINSKDFHLVFQPQLLASTGKLVRIEALLRCQHPTLRTRPISDVIHLAADSGNIPRISAWIMLQACLQAKIWLDKGYPSFNISVNLCPGDLADKNTLAVIDGILLISGLEAAHLTVELTERHLIQSKESGAQLLHALSSRGVSIALDNFGAGYSSLSYLTSLPIDIVKLDIECVRGIPANSRACSLVKVFIDLAHTLGIRVVAVGVESIDQLKFLQNAGCDEIQGFYFGEPIDSTLMTAWLETL